MKIPEQKVSKFKKKARKLKRKPVQFFADSKVYINAHRTMVWTWARLGSFCLVLIASFIVITYYGVLASPRYISEAQFVVKQSGNSDIPLTGLAGLGAVSPTMRDTLILKKYIKSREMAQELNKSVGLKSHYESHQWDSFSRLNNNSSVEDYVDYYKNHISVHYDETAEVLHVEVQSFSPEYSLKVTKSLLLISERFINDLGDKLVNQQLEYAEKDVARAYNEFKKQQAKLVRFQDEFELYNPEAQGKALAKAVNQLEGDIIIEETQLKSLLTFMQEDSAEVRVKQARLDALNAQLKQEKSRLTKEDQQSLNKISVNYKEIDLNSKLAADLYKSSLSSLEHVRGEAYRKLKHLLVIESPMLAEESKYPRRVYSIFTWFILLLLIYGIGRLILAIVKEHQE